MAAILPLATPKIYERLGMDGGIRCWLFWRCHGAGSVFSVLVWRENDEVEWKEVEDFMMWVGWENMEWR
jgi:hypothetical protein